MSGQKIEKNKLKIGIVGAGPAGAMAAYLFAKDGYSVEVLERKSKVERKVCGEYLCPKGVELIDDLGLSDILIADFSKLEGMILVSPDGVEIPTYFPETTSFNYGVSLNREIFDSRILNLAQKEGVNVLFNQTVREVSYNSIDSTWYVITEEKTYEYDLLFVADGRQSKIGHFLKQVTNVQSKRVALHCYLPRKSALGLRMGEMHIFSDGSYCGLDPIDDGHINFSIVCDSTKLKTQKPEEIINSAIACSSRLSKLFDGHLKHEDIKVVTSLKNINNFISGNGLAYLGDAAGFIDPLTGEGIYNALSSATLLHKAFKENNEVELALSEYKKNKIKISKQKTVINNIFQSVIRSTFAVTVLSYFLSKSQHRANVFIGIIGNIYSPVNGLLKMLIA